MFDVCMNNNTAIITISNIKTIKMTVVSYFIKAIILQHMFVNKRKIHTRFFFYAASPGVSRKISIYYDNAHFQTTTPPHFVQKQQQKH